MPNPYSALFGKEGAEILGVLGKEARDFQGFL